MAGGQELIRQQLFFRKELMERVQWFIRLRWMAAAAGLAAAWTAEFLGFPVAIRPVSALILFCALYNAAFVFIRRHLESSAPANVRHYIVFAHIQFALDLLVLFGIIWYTGGFFSPLLIFVFFHVLLIGILLAPPSGYVYAGIVIALAGAMIVLQTTPILPPPPPLSAHPLARPSEELADMLAAYGIFAAAVLIAAYLITTVKISLRTKGRELLSISRQLAASNERLRALYDMVKEMHACEDLQSLADAATRNAAVIMGVKACSIKLLDEQRRKLRFVSTYGLSGDYTAKDPIDIDKSLINYRIIRGDQISVGSIDQTHAFQYPEDIVKENIASLVCLPLRAEKMIIGVFCIYSSEPDFFAGTDVDFFSRMADLTALGIENIKNQENRIWFLKKAAHQLRSPLNATWSMLEMVEKGYRGPVTPEQQEVLQRCRTRINLLSEMVSDLLKLGIKRSDPRQESGAPADVRKKLTEVVDYYMPRASAENIRVDLQINESGPAVYADPQLLDNLFSNLVSNAIKYTRPGGTVSVGLSVENDRHVLFEVSDTGIGIPETDVSKIFTEFYRSENAKAHTEQGTGLGLVIVKEALDALGGTITVESQTGKGTRFLCRFPVSGPSGH